MNICSTSFIIGELQIKTIKTPFLPLRLSKIQKFSNIFFLVRIYRKSVTHCWCECQMVQSLDNRIKQPCWFHIWSSKCTIFFNLKNLGSFQSLLDLCQENSTANFRELQLTKDRITWAVYSISSWYLKSL